MADINNIPLGPTNDPGPKGPVGPPGFPDVSTEEGQKILEKIGSHLKIPQHPDPSVAKQIVTDLTKQVLQDLDEQFIEACNGQLFNEAKASGITKADLITAMSLIPKQANKNGDVFLSPQDLKDMSPEQQFYQEHLGVPYEPKEDEVFMDIKAVDAPKIVDFLPKDFPPFTGISKTQKNHLEELWKKSTAKKKQTMPTSDTQKINKTILDSLPNQFPPEAQEILKEAEKQTALKGVHVNVDDMDQAHLLAPPEYDPELVFEVVRQVLDQKLDEETTKLFRKISDTMAEVMIKEREEWKKVYNNLAKEHHKLKSRMDTTFNEIGAHQQALANKCNELVEDLKAAHAEVQLLRLENKKLRVTGSMKKNPRKVKGIE